MNLKYPARFYRDILIRKIRISIKEITPKRLIPYFSGSEDFRSIYLSLNQEDVYPWTSPNIWNEIINFYRGISKPVVFEYGTGASSIAHIVQLRNLNGTYIGIESDKTWFELVSQSIISKLAKSDSEVNIHQKDLDQPSEDSLDRIISTNRVKVILKLRRKRHLYIDGLEESCNVAIVDGKYRVDCVNRILETKFLDNHGMLALMEAGRGSPEWWEGDLAGENDYRSVLTNMLNLGGRLIDGNGVDNWPGLNRKSPNPISYIYPMEACLLIRPSFEELPKNI